MGLSYKINYKDQVNDKNGEFQLIKGYKLKVDDIHFSIVSFHKEKVVYEGNLLDLKFLHMFEQEGKACIAVANYLRNMEDDPIKYKIIGVNPDSGEQIYFCSYVTSEDDCKRLAEGYYTIKTQDGYRIMGIHGISNQAYHKVYTHPDMLERSLKDNMVYVDIKEFSEHGITDKIKCGVDIDTYDIVTPIYSKMQDRIIKLYDEEKAKEKAEEYNYDETHDTSFTEVGLGNFTEEIEVKEALKIIDKHMYNPGPQMIINGKVDDLFVFLMPRTIKR